MPAIHLSGDGWTLVRAWPETSLQEPWQQQLRTLLRDAVLCRKWLQRCESGDLRHVSIDWSHPGIGKATMSGWQQARTKARSTVAAAFDIGHVRVSFSASGEQRKSAASVTSARVTTLPGVTPSCEYEILLDEPIRACRESAALIMVLCEAVSSEVHAVAQTPPISSQADELRPGSNAGVLADAQLRELLEDLQPFQSKVLELICGGWTNAEIAATTRMSVSSVRAATSVIYEHLGVRNRHEAAALCGAAFARPSRPTLER